MIEELLIADQEERTAITTRVHENMCVEAGAGTGKTTVLVERIVNTVAEGHADVRNMAVITFTEKAAAELAGRVRRGLEDALTASTEPERSARIEHALRGLNHAHIETIHAFAASLLRERPVEAGLDPGFDVMDVLPAQLAFETAYKEWLHGEMAADPPPDALLDAVNLGLEFDRVREAAEALHRFRDLLPLEPYAAVDVSARATIEGMADDVELLRSMEGRATDEEDAAYTAALTVVEWYDETLALIDDEGALRRAIVTVKLPGHNGNRDNWHDRRDCKAAKDAVGQIKKELSDSKTRLRANATAGVILWLQGFVRAYDERRRREGKADFDDLLIWSRALVRDNDEVRRYFARKYATVLVDEFQDTDPLQAELVVRLCAEEPVPQDWTASTLRPGSLFVVGDPKQSIYRFRRADIAMYDEVKARLFGGKPRYIVQNFRSVKPVISWVNATFEELFGAGQPGFQPPHVDLAPHPRFDADDAITVLREIAPLGEDGKAHIDIARRLEGAKLAALVRKNIASGAWRVRDKEGGWRPAQYRDVVLLIPSRTKLELYEEAFALANVPYRHEGGRTFFLRQEVRELIAVLRAIDDPGDGVATVAALRSPAFGLSDEELLLYRHAGGRFDYTTVGDADEGPVADALRALRGLGALRHSEPLPDVIRAVLDQTKLIEFAMLQHQGEQVAANMLKLIDQARTFSEASGRGLRGFVRWLKENTLRQSDESDAPISEETDDVVRIVTVHASKGLEFPIVVFANMAGTRGDRTTVIPDRDGQRLQVQLGKKDDGFRTPGFDLVEAREVAHAVAEDQRLLYVAATRARDRLVLSFVLPKDEAPSNKDGQKPLNDWLRLHGADAEPNVDAAGLPVAEGDPPVWRREVGGADAAAAERLSSERLAWQSAHASLLAAGNAPLRVLSASALKPEWDHPTAGDGVRRGSATEFGSAVHAVLERAGLEEGPHVDELAAAVAREFGQSGREREMAATARRALASDAVRRARASRRVLPEVAFVAPLPGDGGLAEGRIDLLFEEAGELVIVDYKTDAVSEKQVTERAAHYRNQALVYAWAARAATGMAVREVIFLFARPGIERAMACDAAFMAEAEELMRRGEAAATVV